MRAYINNQRVYMYEVYVNGKLIDTRKTDKSVNIEGSLPIFRKFYKTEDVRIIRVF